MYSIRPGGRTCSKKTACLNFLCLLPMVLKTRGLGIGATFMRGSYVAEPRLLAWLRERTVLVKSEHELHAIYRECLKLHLQRSLVCQKCVTITYETLFPRAGRARQHPYCIQKPVLGTRYSGTVPCRRLAQFTVHLIRAVTYRWVDGRSKVYLKGYNVFLERLLKF